MKTPREKFENDPQYAALVNSIEAHIHQGNFTPSELREAVVFACVRYEMYHIRPMTIPVGVGKALDTLEDFIDSKS